MPLKKVDNKNKKSPDDFDKLKIIHTSFMIDLSTVDKKLKKVNDFVEDCKNDLLKNNKQLKEPYHLEDLQNDISNRKFKNDLSSAIWKAYMVPQPEGQPALPLMDAEGYIYNTFEAVNTDPNNFALQMFGIKPYKYLKVSILTAGEAEVYYSLVGKKMEADKYFNVLTNINYISNDMLNSMFSSPTYLDFKQRVQSESLIMPGIIGTAFQMQIQGELDNFVDKVSIESIKAQPETSKDKISYHYSIADDYFVNKIKTETNYVPSDSELESFKIRVFVSYISSMIIEMVENLKASAAVLTDFRSKYDFFEPINGKFLDYNLRYIEEIGEDERLQRGFNIEEETKNGITIKFDYYKDDPAALVAKYQTPITDRKVDSDSLKLDLVSFTNTPLRSLTEQFTAMLSPSENPWLFTLIAILYDLEFLDLNISYAAAEFCPPPESFETDPNGELIEKEKKSTKTVVRDNVLDYLTFPENYYIPFSGFCEIEAKLTEDTKQKQLAWYYNEEDTAAQKLARNAALQRQYQKAAENNGLSGYYQKPNTFLLDPESIRKMFNKIENDASSSWKLAGDTLAKTFKSRSNIVCLLDEVKACLLAKPGVNCKDILRGFNVGRIEEILNLFFPQTLYVDLYEALKKVLNDNMSEEQRRLKEEIEKLEKSILNNPRSVILYDLLNSGTLAQDVRGEADTKEKELASSNDTETREEILKKKKEIYMNLYSDAQEQNNDSQKTAQQLADAQKKIDEVLNIIEQFIDIEILCDITRFADFLDLSFTFGEFQWPTFKIPSLMLDFSAQLDDSIFQIIIGAAIQLLKTLIEEILSCNGWSNLIAGAITGDPSQNAGILGNVGAALNQLATGKFDLDSFANSSGLSNELDLALNNIASSLGKSLIFQSTSSMDATNTIPGFAVASDSRSSFAPFAGLSSGNLGEYGERNVTTIGVGGVVARGQSGGFSTFSPRDKAIKSSDYFVGDVGINKADFVHPPGYYSSSKEGAAFDIDLPGNPSKVKEPYRIGFNNKVTAPSSYAVKSNLVRISDGLEKQSSEINYTMPSSTERAVAQIQSKSSSTNINKKSLSRQKKIVDLSSSSVQKKTGFTFDEKYKYARNSELMKTLMTSVESKKIIKKYNEINSKNIIKSPTEKVNTKIISEKQIKENIVSLINEAATALQTDELINLIGGHPTEKTIDFIMDFIAERRPELSFMSNPSTIKNIFSYTAKVSGLQEMREDLLAVARANNRRRDFFTKSFCLPDQRSDINSLSTKATNYQDGDVEETTPTAQELAKKEAQETYADIIKKILDSNPQKKTKLMDEAVFKPLIMGMMPDGTPISHLNSMQQTRIESNLKFINNHFKTAAKTFYSSLRYTDVVDYEINEFAKSTNDQKEDGDNYTKEERPPNPEFKDYESKGVFTSGNSDDPFGKTMTVAKQTIINGGVFSRNFDSISDNLNVEIVPGEELSISLTGKMAIQNSQTEKFSELIESATRWKIEYSEKNSGEISLKTRTAERPITFKNKVSQENIDVNSYTLFSNKITEEIEKGLINLNYDKTPIKNYTKTSYENFIKQIMSDVSKTISEDSLLKSIPDLPPLSPKAMQSLSPELREALSAENPFKSFEVIDTPLKYINFTPNPTKSQKKSMKDPSLLGPLEIKDFINRSMNKRRAKFMEENYDLTSEELYEKRNQVKLEEQSIFDGYFYCLLRVVCSEVAINSIFVNRTFKYDKNILNNMILSSYCANTLINMVDYYAIQSNSKSLYKDGLLEQADIIYQSMFRDSDESEENKFLRDVDNLKKIIKKNENDRMVLMRYKNDKINTKNTLNEEKKKQIKNEIECIDREIQTMKTKLCFLEIRNICQKELMLLFDKLNYITLDNCEDQENSYEDIFKDIVANKTFSKNSTNMDSDVANVLSIPNITPNFSLNSSFSDTDYEELSGISGDLLQIYQEDLSKPYVLEKYIIIPKIKSTIDPILTLARTMQEKYSMEGVVTINNFINFMKLLNKKIPLISHKTLNQVFESDILLGMRLISIIDKNTADIPLDDTSTNRSILEKLKLLNSQNKAMYSIKIPGSENLQVKENIYMKDKTHAVPHITKSGDSFRLKIINKIPLFKQEVAIYNGNTEKMNNIYFIEGTNGASQWIVSKKDIILGLKDIILCNEEFSKYYSILTNQGVGASLLSLAANSILLNKQFASLKVTILSKYLTSWKIIIGEELASIIAMFDDPWLQNLINSAIQPEIILKAGIHVLKYICKMTDPNISVAMNIRDFVKTAISTAQGVAGAVGVPLKPDPVIQTLLDQMPVAPFSLALLPMNVFPPPPVGPGAGPPIMPPTGFIFLALEVLLLAADIWSLSDEGASTEDLNNLLKRYCVNIKRYKEY